MWYENRERRADELLAEAREIAETEGGEVTTEHRTGKPSDEILTYTEEEGIEAVVMGTRQVCHVFFSEALPTQSQDTLMFPSRSSEGLLGDGCLLPVV